MKTILTIILLFCFANSTIAQPTAPKLQLPTSKQILKASIVPVALIAYGSLSIQNNGWPSSIRVKQYRDDHFGSFKNYTDDYLLYSNAAVVYGLDLLKVKAKHDVLNQTIIMTKTSLLALGITGVMKYTFKQTRPDNSDNYSFPSGHTAWAFALACVVHQEFKETSNWFGVFAYTSATITGAMRILNNKHWYSDVLVGAGVGILSTNLVYLTHQNKFKKRAYDTSLIPHVSSKHVGLTWHLSF
jgi:hypothetical protein